MVVIINNLDQRLIINLIGGKNIDLLAKGTARVPEEELSSPHLQALIAKGDILVIPPAQQGKREKIKESRRDRKDRSAKRR